MLRSQKVARRRVQCVMLVAMCGYDPLRLRPSLNLSVFLSLRMAEVSQEERLQAIAVSSFSTHTHTHTHKLDQTPCYSNLLIQMLASK